MDSFGHRDALVKIIPLSLLNNLLSKECFPSVQFSTISFPASPCPSRSHSALAPDTDPEHGAVQEDVALVAHHAVLVQHGDPLLCELDRLRGATERE